MSARPHFSVVGIPVRVEPVFLVIAVLFGLRWADLSIALVGVWVAVMFVSVLVHELGHGLALKLFGQPSAIVLHGFGGVTLSRRTLTRVRSIVVSVAGSLTALVVLWWPARTLLGSNWFFEQGLLVRGAIYFTAFVNLWWSLANLLPIRPLDGGNVATDLFGLPTARRLSVGVAIGAAIFALLQGQTFAAIFAGFLAFNNFQEIRAEQRGSDIDAFEVEAPDPGSGRPGPRRGRRALRSVPPPPPGADPFGLGDLPDVNDPARKEADAWDALRVGDAALAAKLVDEVGPKRVNPFLRAASALAVGSPSAFGLFEDAYVAHPGGPPNLAATEVLARSGAAAAVGRRLVGRADGRGREGAATLQTHLHYAGHYAEAAEVGEEVFAASPASPAQTAFEVACAWSAAGDTDRAAKWLERAADAGFRAARIVDGEPDLAAVREHPRWPELRARLS